ncbi:MAG: DeoR/GlpR transcriptional regulator [Bacteroidales bacterium]|nr:DeoR/GlpR transcriptional regulator [Bacteroidales bacterium]
MNERRNNILELLNKDERISVSELAVRLKVSSVTIRNDLNFLESEGLLKRIHGGAVIQDADDIDNSMAINYEKKVRIACKVAGLVNEGETVLLESGSVNALLARELVKKNVTIITTNIYIARQFRKEKSARIIIMGGLYQHESESLVGKITRSCIDQVNYDKAFIGIDGYTTKTGFTLKDLLRADISSYIIKNSRDVFIVSDSSKFGKAELTNICYLSDIQHIATDNELGSQFVSEFRKAGKDLILA